METLKQNSFRSLWFLPGVPMLGQGMRAASARSSNTATRRQRRPWRNSCVHTVLRQKPWPPHLIGAQLAYTSTKMFPAKDTRSGDTTMEQQRLPSEAVLQFWEGAFFEAAHAAILTA